MKKHYSLFCLIFAVFLITTAACSGGQREQTPEPAVTEDPVYTVKGRFLQFNEENMTISVAHEEIPGVMRSMRMNLRLDNPDEAAALKPGDVISFELTRRGASWFVYDIEVLPEDTVLELPENLRDPGL
jgi:Cu/Ag efflux protein CusF